MGKTIFELSQFRDISQHINVVFLIFQIDLVALAVC